MYVDRSSSTTEGGPRRKQQLLEIRNHNETQNSQQKNFNQQMKLEADEFKKQFRFVDKEKLFMELQSYKQENNHLREENVRHKTRIHQTEKELERYEKICEDMQNKLPKTLHNVSHELLIIQLKKQNKDLNKQLRDKIKENDHLKKNFKVTRLQELEIDRKAYVEETIRLRKIIQEGSASFEAMQQKYGESLLLEEEVQKLLKSNDYLLKEKQALQQKSTQGDEFIKQLQQLYKVSQQKQVALDKQIADLKLSIKKLQNEKTNLKITIKQMQDSQYQAISSLPSAQKSPPRQQQPKPKPINQLLVDEMRYKLTIRGITNQQLLEMLDGLKSQAKDQSIQVHTEDLQHILGQDPFIFSDNNKIQQILQSLHGVGDTLVDSLYKIIGEYKTFQNFPNFNFQIEQAKMKQQLKAHEKSIQDYWIRNKAKGSTVTKTEVRKMLNSLNLNWDEPQQLFYFINLFEKSFENLHQINIKDTIDPFVDEWDQQQQETTQQDAQQSKQQGNPRISEESEEDLYDKQSQECSLDEKALPQKQQNSEEEDEQQQIVFRDEGQIRQGNELNGQDTSNQNIQPKIQFEDQEQDQDQEQENNNQSQEVYIQEQEQEQEDGEQKAEDEDDQYNNEYEEENDDENKNDDKNKENENENDKDNLEQQQVQEDYQEASEQEQEKQYDDDQFE